VCTIARNLDKKVQIVFALSMKRVAMHPESQLFVAVIEEMDESGVGMLVPLAIANVLDDFVN
jgi:hypothetical protein